MESIPDYLSDDSPRRLLNEAESRLTAGQWDDYMQNLREQVRGQGAHPREISTTAATARQRCIAILQVVKPELFR